MINRTLEKLPTAATIWIASVPIAIAIISINTIISRESSDRSDAPQPVAQAGPELPREWSLPPGVVIHRE